MSDGVAEPGAAHYGTRNVIYGEVTGPVVQARDIHLHIPRRLRTLLDSAGSNYLTDAHYRPDGQTSRRREELADQLVRLVIDNPGDLHTAITETTDATEDADGEPWMLDEAVALLALVERRLSEQRIAQQAHTDITERMAVELVQLRLEVAGQREVTRQPELTTGENAAPPAPGQCPYPGLSAFTASQAQWFFGREKLTAKLVRRLAVAQARGLPLFVVGVSGAGKSSLLRAGLIPALLRGDLPVAGSRDWPYLRLQPGARPLTELVTRTALLAGIAAGGAVDDIRANPARFADLVRQAALADARKRGEDGEVGRVVLIVDQFEEIFTQCRDGSERTGFVAALLAAAGRVGNDETTPPALVVLGLRADFFPSCASEPGLAGILQDNQFLVGPMKAAELRSAVEQPAAAVGLTLEPGLASLILRDFADDSGYQPGALPLLGYALEATWARRRGHTITLASYQESGGVRSAIATAAETMFTSVSPPEQWTTRRLLLRLVAVGDGVEDTRRRVPTPWLIGGDGTALRVLNRLVATRLVTATENEVEIAHEALLHAWPRLAAWLNTDRAGLLVHRQLTDATRTWLVLHRDPGSLYRGARLADLRAWLDGRRDYAADLSPAEHEFVQASVAAEEAQRELIRRNNRRLRNGITALAMLLVLTMVTTGIALWQRQVANTQRTQALTEQAIASSREYAAESLAAFGTDTRRSMLLAAASWQTSPTEEARGAILSAQAQPYQGQLGPVSARVWNVALSPDGTTAALAAFEGTVTLWDTRSHRQLARLTGADGEPAVAFSPDGHMLATVNNSVQPDEQLRLWDVRTHKLIRSLPSAGRNVAFSADGTRIVTSNGPHIVLWDLTTSARPIQEIRAGDPTTYGVAISHDNSLIASGGSDNKVHLWLAATGQQVAILRGHTDAVVSVDFNRDDSLLASSSKDGTVRLWDVTQRRPAAVPVLNPPGGNEFIKQALFSPDGTYVVATLNRSLAVQWWRVADGARVGSYSGHTQSVTSIAFSRDGHTLLSGSLDRTAILWKAQSTFLIQPSPVGAVVFSKDGRRLAAGSGPVVTLWDPRRRDPVRVLTGGPNNNSLSFSPDGNTLAAAGVDGTVRLWNADTGILARTFAADDGRVAFAVAFSPDGRTLAEVEGPTVAAINAGGPHVYLVRQWDVASGEELATTTYNARNAAVDPYPGGPIVFSPDSKLLAVPLTTGSIELRQARTAALAGELTGQQGVVVSVAFNAEGTMLASGGADRSIRLWNLATRQPNGAPLTGHNGTVRGVVFLPDGHTLASVGFNDTALRLWDIPTHRPLAVVTGANGAFSGLAVQPGTGLIATAGVNDIIGIWDPDPDSVQSTVCSALRSRQPIIDQWKAIGRDPSQAPHC